MLRRPAEAAPEKAAKSTNYSANITEGFPCFSSVVRQIPGYNSKGVRSASPIHRGFQPKLFLYQFAEAFS
jgi:hypothetical protein